MSELSKEGIALYETVLEKKIEDAIALGIKFRVIPAGQGMPASDFGTVTIDQSWTNKAFEQVLDKVMAEVREKSFMKILKKLEAI